MCEMLDLMFERLDSQIDVLTQVLRTVHLGSVLSSRIALHAPWAVRAGEVRHRAGFHVVVSGRCWALVVGESPVRLGPGDMVLFPHGAEHTLADDPATPAVEFEALAQTAKPGEPVPVSIQGTGERTEVLCGAYTFSADGSHPLLRGMPAVIHLGAERTRGTPLAAAIALLVDEASVGGSGSALAIDRLIDLLFVYALRAWLRDQGKAGRSGWFGALDDPHVGRSIRAIHSEPGRDWTVAALAAQVGLSRAAFSRRFKDAVGEPPLAYVARWRMTVASELLQAGRTIADAGREVGYDNEFAFAKAFKRLRGVGPGQVRRQGRAA